MEELLELLIKVESVLGVYRLGLRKQYSVFTKWLRRSYSIAIIIYSIFISYYCDGDLSYKDIDLTRRNLNRLYMSFIDLYLCYVLLIDFLWNKNMHTKLLLILNEVDNRLKTNIRKDLYAKCKIFSMIIIIPFCLWNLITFLIDCCTFGFVLTLKYIFIYTCFLLFDLESCHFIVLLCSIHTRLHMANQQLNKLIMEKETCLMSNMLDLMNEDNGEKCVDVFDENNYSELLHFYKQITKACTLIGESFDIQIHSHLFECHIVAWTLHFLIPLITICIICEKNVDEMCKSKQLLVKQILAHHEENRDEITTLYKYLQGSKIGEFEVCNMLSLRTPLLLSFVGLLTTYIIIILQFADFF